MEIIVLTREDLDKFREQLLDEIRRWVSPETPKYPKKIKSKVVRHLLKCSPGTLQSLRISGELSYSKVGGTYYYNYDEVMKLLEGTDTTYGQ